MFRSSSDWVIDAYSRLLHNYPQLPIPGRNSLVPVRLASMTRPVYVRLGTSDSAILSEIAENDEYGWVLPQIQGSVRCVIDLGGNFSMSMRFWYENIPDLQAVLVVEPDADNMRAIRRNSEGLTPRPIVVEACIAAWNRPISLRRGRATSGFEMQEASSHESIDTLTMAELLELRPGDFDIDLLKCDIEGTEKELFAQCGEWIGMVRNMVVEVHGTYSVSDLRDDLKRSNARFKRAVESPHRRGVVGFFER